MEDHGGAKDARVIWMGDTSIKDEQSSAGWELVDQTAGCGYRNALLER